MNPDLKAILTGILLGIGGWIALFSWAMSEDTTAFGPAQVWQTWQGITYLVLAACGTAYFAARYRFAIATTFIMVSTLCVVGLWAYTASKTDVTGLFAMGAFILAIGLIVFLMLVAGITAGIGFLGRRRTHPGRHEAPTPRG